ncbi:MAG: hypothetical protein ACRDPA_23990, partial [Solirubrobacteraceae bacterium]
MIVVIVAGAVKVDAYASLVHHRGGMIAVFAIGLALAVLRPKPVAIAAFAAGILAFAPGSTPDHARCGVWRRSVRGPHGPVLRDLDRSSRPAARCALSAPRAVRSSTRSAACGCMAPALTCPLAAWIRS